MLEVFVAIVLLGQHDIHGNPRFFVRDDHVFFLQRRKALLPNQNDLPAVMRPRHEIVPFLENRPDQSQPRRFVAVRVVVMAQENVREHTMILHESTEPQIQKYALDIENAGQTLLAIINDILDLTKIESGKMEIVPLEYDFSSLIHDVFRMTAMMATQKGLGMDLKIDDFLPSGLYGDDVRIRQILLNLLNNAVKYTIQLIKPEIKTEKTKQKNDK